MPALQRKIRKKGQQISYGQNFEENENNPQKKVLYDPVKDTERVKNLTEKYFDVIKPEKTENLRFIDETGALMNMTLPYGRSPEGERAAGTCPVSKGQRISTIGALSCKGIDACMTFEGTLNGEIFLFYLINFLCPVLKKGEVVIIDNAKAHKVEGVRELIESRGAKPVYLPPYSPDLSPIEMCWSKVKHFLKKAEARTKDALNKAISDALNTVTEKDAEGWFEHCGYVI